MSAKTALNELRTSDHALGRPLAICLMFETAENQMLAASVFDLTIALDVALHIPSESLLAAIRIQWWADAVASEAYQNVPLIACLQSQYEMRNNLLPQLQELIGKWQAACHDEAQDSSEGWAAAWRLIAFHLGHITETDKAAKIGQDLYYASRGQRLEGGTKNICIKSLRLNDRNERRSWLYLSACLHRKLHRDQNSYLQPAQTKTHKGLADPAHVWRILSWHLFGPPR